MAGFEGRRYGPNFAITREQFDYKALDLVVPHAGSNAQRAVIERAVRYGATRGVSVNVVIFQ